VPPGSSHSWACRLVAGLPVASFRKILLGKELLTSFDLWRLQRERPDGLLRLPRGRSGVDEHPVMPLGGSRPDRNGVCRMICLQLLDKIPVNAASLFFRGDGQGENLPLSKIRN
jgi:hypothetical protein